jgi:hypothetical protein
MVSLLEVALRLSFERGIGDAAREFADELRPVGG